MLAQEFAANNEPPAPINGDSRYHVENGYLVDLRTGKKIVLKKLALWQSDILSPGFELTEIDLALIDKDYTRLEKLADEKLEEDPDDTSALVTKAIALAEKGDYAASLAVNERVLEIDPDDEAALHNMAIDLDALGKHSEALVFMQKSIDLDPSYAPGLLHKGEILMKLGRTAEAFEAYESALIAEGGGILSPYRQDYIVERFGCTSHAQALQFIRNARAAGNKPLPAPH